MKKYILYSQCIDHALPLVFCLLLVVATPVSLSLSLVEFMHMAPLSLAIVLSGALFISSLSYRTLCLCLWGETLGPQLLGLRARHPEGLQEGLYAHLWEALTLACPPLWALETLMRHSGKKIGFDYVFCYKDSL
jgi:uncharacterized RDD family membrane protein YckC